MSYDEAKLIALEHVSPRIGEVRGDRATSGSRMLVTGFEGPDILLREIGEGSIVDYRHSRDGWDIYVSCGRYYPAWKPAPLVVGLNRQGLRLLHDRDVRGS